MLTRGPSGWYAHPFHTISNPGKALVLQQSGDQDNLDVEPLLKFKAWVKLKTQFSFRKTVTQCLNRKKLCEVGAEHDPIEHTEKTTLLNWVSFKIIMDTFGFSFETFAETFFV